MALRANESHESAAKDGSSAVAGLNPYWNDTQKKPSVERRKCSDLSAVAMADKYSNVNFRSVKNNRQRDR